MKPKILYLHGFGSCGVSTKSTYLKNYFGPNTVTAPDLPSEPLEAIALIKELLESGTYELLIGSSLGGYYAAYMAEMYSLKAVLLNPSTEPWITLADHVGWQKRFCDGQLFEFKKIYLDQLKTLQVNPQKGCYLVLLHSEDEILDYRIAKAYYADQRVIVEYGGNHRFENIEDYISMIDHFRK
ncbi:MAG: hypothetical protein IE885_03070 [Campylobacterales bacterium]|nr:hypothetical protein [Campylobacterales bacterium]